VEEIRRIVLEHLAEHYTFHGEEAGVRTARKHLGWYASELAGGEAFRHEVNRLDTSAAQIAAVNRFFDRLAELGERLECRPRCAVGLRGEEALAA